MLERLVEHIQSRDGVTFKTMRDVAGEFRRSCPPGNPARA
jgi:hypothetical protein